MAGPHAQAASAVLPASAEEAACAVAAGCAAAVVAGADKNRADEEKLMMNSRHYKDRHYARGSIVTCASLALLAFIFCLRAESQTPTASAGDGSNQPQLFA